MQSVIYMWQVSACMGVFYGFYFCCLRQLTFFTLNRWYLLLTMVISFIIPLITITVHQQLAPGVIKKAIAVNQQLPSSNMEFVKAPATVSAATDWIKLIEISYLVITLLLLIKLILTIVKFFNRLKKANISKVGNVFVVEGSGNLDNGSFFNYIFIDSKNLNPSEIEQVIAHEMLHVKFSHSIDRVIAKLAQVVLWFNPFVYSYAQAIEENHEFEVDYEIGKIADKGSYADMLLHLSVNRRNLLFNSFSKAPLKRRITMLFTKPTNHMKKIVYVLIVPVLLLSCVAFARFKNYSQEDRYSAVQGSELLGDKFELLIDGKKYDKDVIFNISASCIKSSRIKGVYPQNVRNGKWADAVVEIKTKTGEVVYMTPSERENLRKERAVAPDKFYTRLHLTDEHGKAFDKVIIKRFSSSVASSADVTIGPDDKVGFIIDDVFYNENDIRFIDQKKISSLSNTVTGRLTKPGEYARGIAAVFYLSTNKRATPVDTTRVKPKAPLKRTKSNINKPAEATSEPKTDYATTINSRSMTASEERLVQSTFRDPAAPFLSRFHFQRDDSNDFDVVVLKVGYSGGSAILDKNEKVGTFIDGKFYNEEAIKKLSPEKIATLVIDNNADRSTFEKMPENENYAVPFYFKTKQ